MKTKHNEPSGAGSAAPRVRPRNDTLLQARVPLDVARPLKQRLAPLHRRYWLWHGHMSIEDALLSAYLQGVRDCVLLEAGQRQSCSGAGKPAELLALPAGQPFLGTDTGVRINRDRK